MSELNLPEPTRWRGGRWFLPLAGVVGFGITVVYAALGLTAATRGNFLTAMVSVGWVVFLLTFLASVLLVGSDRSEARITSDASGFTLLPDRRFTLLMLIGVVASIPSSAVFAVCAPLGLIEFADTRMLQTVGAGAAAVVVLTGVSGLVVAWRRGGVGHVKLTPAMIENADILATRMFEWDDVMDVTDHAESRKSRRAVVLRLRDGNEEIISFANIYVPRGAALYWLVRHYWRHPEDRMELVDSRALERLRGGQFDFR
ncbi:MULTISPECIES: hypothetical protein [Mycobacterium]|uniref:Uncharacterized protein n=1 Tax=Mycobacterium syngnathidarum TaxID=1908205 RepID=A0A1Q9W3Y6_9MYCO|nr:MULTISPECIES: hypothetical protein [Mycobacterium]MCG7607958.1 hypothetical protein [Mycobacterium sp. CnD-18-1]OHT90640.1 hypothetical protein BKG61_27395 [Mycobacterium syngnathidarum]OLT88105.1 hypothetical protein BKG60_27610 [Mycobacterium syngnathidarum]